MLGLGLWRYVVLRNVTSFRRSWLIFVSGFLEPIFYLFSIGVGLGTLVRTVTSDEGRLVDYATFVAPALLAAAAMNGAIADVTVNVFFKLRHARLYDTMLATPVSARDIASGEVMWALMRGGAYAAAFLSVALVMGFVHSWWALLAVPAAVLLAAAFAGVGMWATTFLTSWQQFEIIFLVVQPMFFFSGTFFPAASYPESMRWLIQVSPLYHGVAVERALFLGEVSPTLVFSVGYLLALAIGGLWGAGRRVEGLLTT